MSKLQLSSDIIEDPDMPTIQRIFVSLSFVIVLLLIPFLHVYALNITNLQFPLFRIGPSVFGLIAVIFLGLWGVQKFLSHQLEKKFQVFLIFVSVIVWMQTNFFVGDYGFLDGREPDWQADKLTPYLQVSFQLLILVFFVFRHKLVSQNASFISIMLLLSSTFSLFPYYSAFFGVQEKKYAFNASQVFEFSKRKNVIVILVDTLQADVVNEILTESPDLKDVFSGFTFFRNSVSAFSKTYASVPALLSGIAFDNSSTLPIYLKETYREKSLPARLLKEGYDVRLHSFAPYSLVAHPEVAMNVAGTKGNSPSQEGMLQKDLVLLANLSLFKLAPHLIKPWIYNGGNFRIPLPPVTPIKAECALVEENVQVSRNNSAFDAKFFDEFLQCASASLDKSTFRYFHLSGAHAPFQFDKKFEYIEQQTINRNNFKAQTRGVFSQLENVFNKLRDLNIYDNATIVVLGDHGAGDLAVDLNLKQVGLPLRTQQHSKLNEQKVMGGIAALLYKPAKSKGEIRISDVPASLTDVAHTIHSELGLKSQGFPGLNLFEIKPGDQRVRLHKYYEFGGWDIDYILPLTEYVIRGFSWFPESWAVSDRNLNIIKDLDYKGLIISMVSDGNLSDYDAGGWGKPLENGTKLEANEAKLRFQKSFNGEVVLQMTYQSYPVSVGTDETITLALAGQMLGKWNFYPGDGQRKKVLVIPEALANKLSQESLSLRSSKIESGVRIKEFRIDSPGKYDYNIGTEIDFSNTGLGKKYQTFGWSTAEKWGSFSLGHRSGLMLKLGSHPERDLGLNMNLDALLFEPWNEQRISIIINDQKIEDLIFRDTRAHQVTLKIPQRILYNTSLFNIQFVYHNAIKPESLGTSTDTRYLAQSLKNLRIYDWDKKVSIQKVQPKSFQLLLEGGDLYLQDSEGDRYLVGHRLNGYLDGVTNDGTISRFGGWAVNTEKPRDKPFVVMFEDDKFLTVRKLNVKRPDVASHFGESELHDSGFSFSFPNVKFNGTKTLKLFVVSDLGHASEFVYPPRFRSGTNESK
ncbi:MAG: sulfatase-like hydrolase/transferase [Pseudomonadales bacterium]|nr:sulfatase-like hydrolase/transferase [Pseudomonadales bacterium]